MAPKKASSSVHEPSKKEREHMEMRPTYAFFPPGLNPTETGKVALSAATAWNEHGATVCHPASFDDLTPGDVWIFSCFIMTGLVPPMSLFFHAIMAAYGLHVSHIHPNAMLTLAMF